MLHTNKCTNLILYINLKLFTLNTFTAPTCFDSTLHIIIIIIIIIIRMHV